MSNKNEEYFNFNISRLITQIKKLERNPRQYGEAGILTPSEIHIVNIIGCGEGILMSELALRIGVTKGAITQIISRMEEKGFVRRNKHKIDARVVVVSLSEKGVLAYNVHHELHEEFCQKLYEQLSPQEIETFGRCIDKFCDTLKE